MKLEHIGFHRGDSMDKYDKLRVKEKMAKKPKETKKETPKKNASKAKK